MPRIGAEEDPDQAWLDALLGREGNSRRGRALAAAAALEELLELLISATLARHPEREQAMKSTAHGVESLSQKIRIARAIEAITERETLQCDVLRLVRNEFAHTPDASFYNGTDLINIMSKLGDPPHDMMRERGAAPLDASSADLAHHLTISEVLLAIRKRVRGS